VETPGHLIVDVARLNPDGESFSGETDPGVMELDAAYLYQPHGGIRYRVQVERIGGELLVRGAVSHRFVCPCSRCAEFFEREIGDSQFFANYPVEDSTEFVDLTPEMREAIILALPGYPVCRDDCKGLCAHCGANLNRKRCSCRPVTTSGSWAGLDRLGKV